MRPFTHFSPKTLDESVALLQRYGNQANLIAGGTDLLGKLKDRILPGYPEALIDLKQIPNLNLVELDTTNGVIRVGALALLEDIAENQLIRNYLPALAQAASRTASPHLRAMGTLAGNLCQDIRCWYYRHADNRFPCLRKGGGNCYAIEGDNRYHSIFGGSVDEGCYAVHPSDTAPALVALNAVIHTTQRILPIEALFGVGVQRTTVLQPDEIVTEIRIPMPAPGTQSAFLKFAMRKSIDFPIVNCAACVTTEQDRVAKARICLNAVYITPYRPFTAEETLQGKLLTEETIAQAADAAVAAAQPMSGNRYMIRIARTLIKRVLAAMQDATM
jgi:xanthine dehydrogenase YagS FAD-binding subunit